MGLPACDGAAAWGSAAEAAAAAVTAATAARRGRWRAGPAARMRATRVSTAWEFVLTCLDARKGAFLPRWGLLRVSETPGVEIGSRDRFAGVKKVT
jgi:hypothetical protein